MNELSPAPARARWAGRALVGVIAVVMAIDAVAVVRMWDRMRPVVAGHQAPAFTLPRIGLGGAIGPESVVLASLRGKVVIIDFWETWCAPCRDAMPALERLVSRHGGRGVALLSVAGDGVDKPARARRMVDELAPQADLVADDGAVADRYGVATIPHVVLVDRDGRVIHVHRRYRGAATLERELAAEIERVIDR